LEHLIGLSKRSGCKNNSENFPYYRNLRNITPTKIKYSKVNIMRILLGKFGGPAACAKGQHGSVILTRYQSRNQDEELLKKQNWLKKNIFK
jgi:hypothetical protein